MKKNILTLLLCLSLALSILPGLASQAESFDYKDADLNTEAGADAVTLDLSALSGTHTITQGGDYLLTGSMNGQLLIQAGESDKVHLLLNNASISNPSGVAIYGADADKIILTLRDGTRNTVTDGVGYAMDEEGADAAIYTKTDLSINGTGSLTITGNTAHGIVSKDDLVIAGGQLNVSAVKDGIRGKDRLVIREGDHVIKAGSDGMHANDEEEGNIIIDGGGFTITAVNDGIQAQGSLTINDGVFMISTGDTQNLSTQAEVTQVSAMDTTTSATGQNNADQESRDAWGNLFGERQGGWNELSQTEGQSAKGIKAGGSLTIHQGSFYLNTLDDSIHSNTEVVIHDGNFEIVSGDDGIHADVLLHIKGGNILITESYEGLESKAVVIDGGMLDITARDDAINAADGTASSGGRGFGSQNQEGVSVTINGGIITATGGTDAIDSNGDIVINGGEVNLTSVSGSGRGGNLALDASGTYTHNGGTVITNDGSDTGNPRQPGRRPRQ